MKFPFKILVTLAIITSNIMAWKLLTPLKIGSLELANRVVMAPLTRGRAGVSRLPNDYMRQYYEARASAGLIITEATAISEQGYGWYGAPGLYTEQHALAWKLIVDAVHNKGGKIFMQLWHMGRKSHSSFNNGKPIVAPSAIKVPEEYMYDANLKKVPPETPRALTTEEIPSVVQQYKHSAELAKFAGFDGVEIHGANGYLIDEFLQSISNHRQDAYGGSYENRYRFLKEIIDNIIKVYPNDRIGVRLSPNGVYSGMGSDDNEQMFPYVAKELSKYQLAYLHLMDGLGWGWHNKCQPVTVYDMKKNFNGIVMGNVGLTKESAEGLLRSGAADLVAFGRLYLSNPDLVERFKNDWPLNEVTSNKQWFGFTPDPRDSLEGYLGYHPYQPKN
eukprot:gene4215-4515_t